MFTYVLGLISPEALTTDARSSRCAFPVCTVTTFLWLWYTVKATMTPSTTTAPTPMATFFQVFIQFQVPRSKRLLALPLLDFRGDAVMGDTSAVHTNTYGFPN